MVSYLSTYTDIMSSLLAQQHRMHVCTFVLNCLDLDKLVPNERANTHSHESSHKHC